MPQLTHLLKKEREKKAIPREEVKGSNALKNLATFTKKVSSIIVDSIAKLVKPTFKDEVD